MKDLRVTTSVQKPRTPTTTCLHPPIKPKSKLDDSKLDHCTITKKSSGSFSPTTASTCSSWSFSPSSLSLRTAPSADSCSDGNDGSSHISFQDGNVEQSLSNGNRTIVCDELCSSSSSNQLTAERKKWIEKTLLNNEYRPYSTNVRRECCKTQNKAFTSERKRWVEETLLSKQTTCEIDARNKKIDLDHSLLEGTASSKRKWIEETLLTNNNTERKTQKLELQDLNSSVAQRRQWLSEVTSLKSVAELEEEVRKEQLALKEEKRKVRDLDATIVIEEGENKGEEGIEVEICGFETRESEVLDEEKEQDGDKNGISSYAKITSSSSIERDTFPNENGLAESKIQASNPTHSNERMIARTLSKQAHPLLENGSQKKKKFLKGLAKKLSPKKSDSSRRLYEI